MTLSRPVVKQEIKQANLRLITGVSLFLFTFLTRLPFRTQYLYHWDSVDYALALQRFSLRDFQPHPPGYLFYVALGGIVNRVLNDANAAYVWISIIASALAVLLLYFFISEWYGNHHALWSCLIMATSPLFWFYGEVALPYTLDLAIVILIAWLSYRALQGQSPALWASALALGLAGGVRPQTTIILFPLWLFAVHRQALWKIASGILLIALGSLLWFLPLASTIGGIVPYINFIRAYSASLANLSPVHSVRSFAVNLGRFTGFLFYAIPFGLPIFALAALCWLKHQRGVLSQLLRGAFLATKQFPDDGIARAEIATFPTKSNQPQASPAHALTIPATPRKPWLADGDWFLVFWMFPLLLFLLLFHLEQPGHIMVLLSPCAIALSRIISVQDNAIARAIGAAVILINIGFFLFIPTRLVPRPEAVIVTPSRNTVQQRDR